MPVSLTRWHLLTFLSVASTKSIACLRWRPRGPLCDVGALLCRDGAGRREAPAERRPLRRHRPHTALQQHAAHPQEGQRGHQDHIRELRHRFDTYKHPHAASSTPRHGVVMSRCSKDTSCCVLGFSFFLSSLLDQYGSVWSGGVSSGYSYNTNHINQSSSSTLSPSGR